MKKCYFDKIKAFALTFFLCLGATLSAQDLQLQILHYADADGNEESALDAVDEFSALVDFFQNDATFGANTLTVASGDLIIPGPRFYAAENTAVRTLSGSNEPGHLDIAFANAFGLDASTFGNHEFDQGPGELFDAAFQSESFSGTTYPGSEFAWLSTNIDFSADGEFAGVTGTDGDALSNLTNQVAGYAVATIDGQSVGIVGAAAPSFPNITSLGSLVVSPAPGSSVADLAAEIQPSVTALENAGVNKIILLAHMQSLAIEKQLATLLDGVDVIVAGGSNTRMGDSNDVLFSNSFVTDASFDETYPFQTTDAGGDPVLVVNVDGDYKYLGRLVVDFDMNGVIDTSALDDTINGAYASNESMVSMLGATPNPDVVALRDAVQGVIDAQFNNIVGFSSVYLDGRRSQVRTQETNLGNLTADANLWYANLLNPATDDPVDISLKNGGGLRTEIGSAIIPGGSNDPDDIVFSPPADNEVSEGNLRATLRFDNGLVRLTMTAAELVGIVEHGLALTEPGAQPGRFPQVSGMTFVYDPNEPAGSRLLELIVDRGDADASNDVIVVENGAIVAPSGTTFNMVTLDFLAGGGDSYPFPDLAAANRLDYETDGVLANDPGNNSTFSQTGAEQDALAEFMSTFHADNANAYDIAETPADQDTRIVVGQNFDLEITEIFAGQAGSDLTADWFEITNNGSGIWASGVNPDLFYDDESADASTADLIQGITDIQPGESVVVLITDNANDITEFQTVWGQVLDLTNVEIGFTDGAGLGGGGDAVTIWSGDPTASSPIDSASYPDTVNNDGQSYDVDLAAFSTVGNTNGAVATILGGGDNSDVFNIGSPGNAPAASVGQISFDDEVYSVNENDGSIDVELSISQSLGSDASVDVAVIPGGTATEGSDYTFTPTTVTFTSGSTDNQVLNIPIIDNSSDDSDLFFVLEISNPSNAELGTTRTAIYILDDDSAVPQTDDTVLDMNYLTSYSLTGTAEIVKFDAASQQLYVVNDEQVDIVDLSDPLNPSPVSSIDVTSFGDSAQSVDVFDGLVAIAVAANVVTDPGSVIFTDIDGNNPVQVQVGALPDMLTFTPDGTKVLVANEGEPNDDYSVDPEGSVSIIDVTGGLAGITNSNVTTLNFNAFDSQLTTLIANDVRIFGPGASVSQDLEPEFITVTDDNQTAYLACQENNAYAIVDLGTNTITDIVSFGLKDHSLPENSLDVSDETDFIFDATWPIFGMYMPDGIDTFNVGGVNYLITANEGDAREYDTFEEERKIDDNDYTLDPAVFSNIDILELESNLAEINVTNVSGDANNDGLFEEIHVYGGRSFSIFNADAGTLVYDSGNDFERITAADPVYGAIFNASNSNNNLKNRSDNKGPEPENVIVQEIDGSLYAFVILERIGGVMAYDVTDPTAPVFLEYENNRGATPGVDETGDLGPEGIVYISPEDSGTDTALIVLSNEVSGTLSIYELSNITLSTDSFALGDGSFKVYPNPAGNTLKTNQVDNYEVYDLNGRKVLEAFNTAELDVKDLSGGIYIIQNALGNSLKFVKL
ncbi:MAG: choice-of-anchor I family protein [Bacteroidota bacterium]